MLTTLGYTDFTFGLSNVSKKKIDYREMLIKLQRKEKVQQQQQQPLMTDYQKEVDSLKKMGFHHSAKLLITKHAAMTKEQLQEQEKTNTLMKKMETEKNGAMDKEEFNIFVDWISAGGTGGKIEKLNQGDISTDDNYNDDDIFYENSDSSQPIIQPILTKNQRKRRNKKLRKQQENEKEQKDPIKVQTSIFNPLKEQTYPQWYDNSSSSSSSTTTTTTTSPHLWYDNLHWSTSHFVLAADLPPTIPIHDLLPIFQIFGTLLSYVPSIDGGRGGRKKWEPINKAVLLEYVDDEQCRKSLESLLSDSHRDLGFDKPVIFTVSVLM